MLRASCVLVWCAGVAFAPAAAVAGEPAAPDAAAEDAAAATSEPADASVATPIVTAPVVRPPAVEVVTAKKVRHDWYVGFGFGIGGGNLRATATGTGASGTLTLLARAGGRLTDKVALGGLVVTSFGGNDKSGVSGFSNLLVEGLFFPVKGRGLGLAVGLGLSSAWLREQGPDGVIVERKTSVGAGFGAGVGYDFWVARRFNVGIWLRGDGSGGRYGVRGSGSLGLAFSWY